MFERFTNPARHVIVSAQEEARGLRHNYIGTEHLLLGLFHEPEEIAARFLASSGMTLESARDDVTKQIGPGKAEPEGHIPFTPRAKKALEMAFRESKALNHDYIGTEHLLLGLIRLGEGVGPRIIAERCGDLLRARLAILDLLPASATTARPRHWWSSSAKPGAIELGPEVRVTAATEVALREASRLAGLAPVGSHHLLLAALADPGTAAARTLAGLGVDLEQARAALRDADLVGTSDETPEESGRRQMRIRAGSDRLTVEVSDPLIVGLGRAAAEALADKAEPGGVIPGELPASVSLANVWQALRRGLEDIRERAAGGGTATTGGTAASGGTTSAAASGGTTGAAASGGTTGAAASGGTTGAGAA